MALYTVTNLTNGTVIPPPPFGRTLGPHQRVQLSAKVADAENDAVQAAINKGLISVTSANDPNFSDAIEGGATGAAGLSPGDVGTSALANGAVLAAKAAVFVSTEQAATGAPQNVAHGLGAVPSLVLVVPTDGHDGAGSPGTQMPDIAEGAHDATNVVVTVTAGASFKVLAWA